MKALILGAGIGGLTTGIALRRAGWEVQIWEATTGLRAVGAGLLIHPNAMKALAALELDPSVTHAGTEIAIGQMMSSRGALIQEMDLLFGGQRGAAVGIHRARLQELLVNALGEDVITLGKRVDAAQINRALSGEAPADAADEALHNADLIVAADGARSITAAEVFGAPPLKYSGYTCFRGVADLGSEGGNRDTLCEVMGRGRRFGLVPIGDGLTYWFATLNAPAGKKYPLSEIKAKVQGFFDSFPQKVRSAIAATDPAELLHNDISDRGPLKSWTKDHLTLLGDAAHPMTPNLGQGACQAIEDALILAQCLSPERCKAPEEVAAALSRYQELRLMKSSKIVLMSRRMGMMGQLESPLLRWLRDLAFRLTPQKVSEKQVLKLLG